MIKKTSKNFLKINLCLLGCGFVPGLTLSSGFDNVPTSTNLCDVNDDYHLIISYDGDYYINSDARLANKTKDITISVPEGWKLPSDLQWSFVDCQPDVPNWISIKVDDNNRAIAHIEWTDACVAGVYSFGIKVASPGQKIEVKTKRFVLTIQQNSYIPFSELNMGSSIMYGFNSTFDPTKYASAQYDTLLIPKKIGILFLKSNNQNVKSISDSLPKNIKKIKFEEKSKIHRICGDGNGPFLNNTGVKEILFPKDTISFVDFDQDSIFANTPDLEKISFCNFSNDGNSLCRDCTKLNQVEFNGINKWLGSEIFRHTALKSIKINSTTHRIGDYAFADIPTLKDITFNGFSKDYFENLLFIGNGIFNNISPTGTIHLTSWQGEKCQEWIFNYFHSTLGLPNWSVVYE